MILTDTHTHLYAEEFDTDRDEMIKRAIQNNITRFFLPNIDSSSIIPMLSVCEKYPQHCFPTIGLHPCYVKENVAAELKIMEQHLRANKIKFYAIGEIGIDFYWDKTFAEQQLQAFEKQIEWAIEFNLPIIIHVRKAFNETYQLVKKYIDKGLRGIFHCFSGSMEEANLIMQLKTFKIGIGGVVTFKNAGLNTIIPAIPLDFIVLETDSPYLAPIPYRGKRNESAYLSIITKHVADLKNASVLEIAEATTKNSTTIFGI